MIFDRAGRGRKGKGGGGSSYSRGNQIHTYIMNILDNRPIVLVMQEECL